MAKITKQIKIQKQGAVSMTIPMIVVHTLGIKIGDYLIVSQQGDKMLIELDKGQSIPVEYHRIKVQRQGAINMTIPMAIVRTLGIQVGSFVNVEFDPVTETMEVFKSKALV